MSTQFNCQNILISNYPVYLNSSNSADSGTDFVYTVKYQNSFIYNNSV